MEFKLSELNVAELSGSGFKYVITTYADITEIEYFEHKDDLSWLVKNKFSLPSCYDLQVCEKIIEIRKLMDSKFKE